MPMYNYCLIWMSSLNLHRNLVVLCWEYLNGGLVKLSLGEVIVQGDGAGAGAGAG